jgi:hypothetical protein
MRHCNVRWVVSDVSNEHVGFILKDPADKVECHKSGYIGTVSLNIILCLRQIQVLFATIHIEYVNLIF